MGQLYHLLYQKLSAQRSFVLREYLQQQTNKQTNSEWCLCSECIMFYDVMVVVEVVVEVVPYFPILWNVGTESRVLLLISKSGKRSKENIDWMEKIWFSKKMLLVNCNF
jgi:hypothetical protein